VDLSGVAKEGESPRVDANDIEQSIRCALGGEIVSSIKVLDHPFVTPESVETPPEDDGGLASPAFLLEMGKRVSLGVLVFGFLAMLWLFRGRKPRASDEQAVGALPGAEGAALTGAAAGMLPGQAPDVLRQGISRALENNPEEVKRLFLKWASNEKGGS